ncbi:hypothetical protein HYFRA_00003611 [Hymenoscyphus fraxineus]|uniref:Uncharacterized protein n=1 Tax=Hymenoscyphus fraxineus TaxID=746836 RepID=A0A9N9KYD1_9HELO|nr:hypothetical protein HYFRA_00003611 [Hymenoscyphus fraxineus]
MSSCSWRVSLVQLLSVDVCIAESRMCTCGLQGRFNSSHCKVIPEWFISTVIEGEAAEIMILTKAGYLHHRRLDYTATAVVSKSIVGFQFRLSAQDILRPPDREDALTRAARLQISAFPGATTNITTIKPQPLLPSHLSLHLDVPLLSILLLLVDWDTDPRRCRQRESLPSVVSIEGSPQSIQNQCDSAEDLSDLCHRLHGVLAFMDPVVLSKIIRVMNRLPFSVWSLSRPNLAQPISSNRQYHKSRYPFRLQQNSIQTRSPSSKSTVLWLSTSVHLLLLSAEHYAHEASRINDHWVSVSLPIPKSMNRKKSTTIVSSQRRSRGASTLNSKTTEPSLNKETISGEVGFTKPHEFRVPRGIRKVIGGRQLEYSKRLEWVHKSHHQLRTAMHHKFCTPEEGFSNQEARCQRKGKKKVAESEEEAEIMKKRMLKELPSLSN